MNAARLKIPTIVLAVVALVVGVSSGAVAAKLITGKDIKDNTVTSADVKNGTLVTKDLKHKGVNGSRLQKGTVDGAKLKKGTVGNGKLKDGTITSKKIADGTIEAHDLSAAARNSLKGATGPQGPPGAPGTGATYAGPNWGIVDRNVISDGDAFLRAGPTSAFLNQGGQRQTPPMGIGSLGIRNGADDKVSFGNQVDYQGVDISSISTLNYWAFTTGENIAGQGSITNLPSIQFEINPNLANRPGDIFATADFVPPTSANLPGWNHIDATTTGEWFLTGQTGTDVGCTSVTTCTFAQLKTALDDGDASPATIFTVQFTKGRDGIEYSGAVDKLTINDPGTPSTIDIFDFEPFGVSLSHP